MRMRSREEEQGKTLHTCATRLLGQHQHRRLPCILLAAAVSAAQSAGHGRGSSEQRRAASRSQGHESTGSQRGSHSLRPPGPPETM
jgi:hypothetical protein